MPPRTPIDPEDPASYQAALSGARLETEFVGVDDGSPTSTVREYEPVRLVATVTVFACEQTPSAPVAVAYRNAADLACRSANCELEPQPVTDREQLLVDGASTWMWDVTPGAAGTLTMILTIRPIVIYTGTNTRVEEEMVNRPIRVSVEVHPQRDRLAMVAARLADTQVSVPTPTRPHAPVVVQAVVPRASSLADVRVSLDLDVPDTIAVLDGRTVAADEAVSRTWTLTPNEAGTFAGRVLVRAATEWGIRTETTDPQVIGFVLDVERPLATRLQPWLTALGALIAIPAAVLGAVSQWRKLRASRDAREDAEADDGPPGSGGPDAAAGGTATTGPDASAPADPDGEGRPDPDPETPR